MIIDYWLAFIRSFIHTEHLYSASSRELLRGAPDSSTAKKSSLKLRKKRLVMATHKYDQIGKEVEEEEEED